MPSTHAHECPAMNLIEIRDLSVAFSGQTVVRNLCLDVRPGECLALVGESGSGKSVTAHSILQLLPEAGTETTGSIKYRGQELVGASAATLQKLRGNRIAMIFQEPMTSLNPPPRGNCTVRSSTCNTVSRSSLHSASASGSASSSRRL